MSIMDLVATSQPLYEQELSWPPDLFSSNPAPELHSDSDHEWDDDDTEVVASSQPFDDGEEDLKLPLVPASHPLLLFCNSDAPSSSPTPLSSASMDSNHPHPCRAHLVFRASPVKPKSAPTLMQGTASRPRNLVRRVTMDAEIARRRNRACKKARRIVKKIRALATATMKLKRQHRKLCEFVGSTYAIKKHVDVNSAL